MSEFVGPNNMNNLYWMKDKIGFLVQRKNLGGKEAPHTISVGVKYQWKPRACHHCQIFGHFDSPCPSFATQINTPTTANLDASISNKHLESFPTVVDKGKAIMVDSPSQTHMGVDVNGTTGLQPAALQHES
ncbi:unnamed protein product [Ilex paraguariensis]|uniref:Zinc knuckle CX2CX4HX4C domain-containing protein n=1 Tax=Ilex paraguariensis TaxID=185542 RepID=A0ABC8UDD5_9AQUA